MQTCAVKACICPAKTQMYHIYEIYLGFSSLSYFLLFINSTSDFVSFGCWIAEYVLVLSALSLGLHAPALRADRSYNQMTRDEEAAPAVS